MRIVIDLQACQTEQSGLRGIGRYSLSLAKAMAEFNQKNELRVALNGVYSNSISQLQKDLPSLLEQQRLSYYHYPVTQDEAYFKPLASTLVLHHYSQLQTDVLHISSIFEGFNAKAVVPQKIGKLSQTLCSATLYDLIPLVFKEKYLENSAFKSWYYEKLGILKNCDLLLAISESTRQDAINYLNIDPQCVVNISGAVEKKFKKLLLEPNDVAPFLAKYGIRKDFVLYAGGMNFRKNMQGMISGYAAVPQDVRKSHQLVVVCALDNYNRNKLRHFARRCGLHDEEIVLTGYVSDSDLVFFYNLCKLFVFPSLYEGFGLPLLEAMSCGAPVIGANNSSIPEVIDWQEALFDLHKKDAMSNLINKALSDKGYRLALIENGKKRAENFSWEKTAEKAIAAYTETHQRLCAVDPVFVAPHLPRYKLAYFSPLPKQRSGIASYSAELLPVMARHFDIDLFVDDCEVEDDWLKNNFNILSYDELDKYYDQYDIVIYNMGNSEFHAKMYRLLQKYPGIVILHDFFLSGLIKYIDTRGDEKGFFWNELSYSHGTHLAWKTKQVNDVQELQLEYPINHRVIDNAIGVIVHSPYLLDLVRKFYPQGVKPPLKVIKQIRQSANEITGESRNIIRRNLGIQDHEFIICSFGFIAFTKLYEVIINAFASSLLAKRPDIRLIFVGDVAPAEYEAKLLALIEHFGLNERIKITGYQTVYEYNGYLAAADLAIQLRANSRGETSRAVLDCLACRVPVIVNAYATFNDYPNNTVYKIPEEVTTEALCKALEELYTNKELRSQLKMSGADYIYNEHNPKKIAAHYATTINELIERKRAAQTSTLISDLGKTLANFEVAPNQIRAIAAAHILSKPSFNTPRLLIDVSHICIKDYESGIQRVVRCLVSSLYENCEMVYHPQVVKLENNKLYDASSFFNDQLNDSNGNEIMIRDHEILLMLDSSWPFFYKFADVFSELKARKGKVYTVVYDLIPVLHPQASSPEMTEMFSDWINSAVRHSDGLICTSQAVADELLSYITENKLTYDNPLNIGSFHLGAIFPRVDKNDNLEQRKELSSFLQNRNKMFLMVGTIEPRKGHEFALNAFELLWQQGLDISLCIAGKAGWNVDSIMSRIHEHQELGKKLLFIENPNDSELLICYRSATALVFPSLAEGFGLPIVEAAQNGLPVIASEIPVLREIAGDNVTFFSLSSPLCLSDTIKDWLLKPNDKGAGSMTWLTWQQSSEQLLQIILKNNWYKTLEK